ncbi:MAG: hypothetical protein COB02_05470 [Candidatus Cloacimonadota bacterium]|nr:MAG: hypothetical protein COB02_05470 [Candidatus Cloacimonadota bacterium]
MSKNKDDFDDKFFNKLLIVMTLSSFIGFTFLSFYARKKEKSPDRLGRKECFLVQKNLSEKADKFDKDFKTKLIVTSNKSWVKLIEKDYIKAQPVDPQCSKSDHYRRDQMSNVFCLYHGSFKGYSNDYSEAILGKADCKNK